VAERIAYEQALLPFRTDGADVLYCPGNFIPLIATLPTVVAQQNPRYFGVGRRIEKSDARLGAERALAKASLKRADAVVVISAALKAEMDLDGVTSLRCTVIQSGAPDAPLKSQRPGFLPETGPFFLSLANDSHHKRLDDLVLAWGKLGAENPPALVMAGRMSAGRVSQHRALVPPPQRDALFHLGPISNRAQVQWLLENALALVITSELEAFPLTPAEAGLAGCPLLLTDIPPHREVTQGRGTYFRTRDVGALAMLLADFAEHPPDRERWCWPITWESNARQLADVLESVAG
jgi:glycosyltransferase involved in cell wall biosynthesis